LYYEREIDSPIWCWASISKLGAGAGVPDPELRHILPELDNSGKNFGRQLIMKNYFIFQQTFGIKWEN
jgi:hypothetical protein